MRIRRTRDCHDYRFSLQLRVKRLLHRNEEGIQINMENTASHETVYKLAHRAAKANFSSFCDLIIDQSVFLQKLFPSSISISTLVQNMFHPYPFQVPSKFPLWFHRGSILVPSSSSMPGSTIGSPWEITEAWTMEHGTCMELKM
jgi:hypothetical protein